MFFGGCSLFRKFFKILTVPIFICFILFNFFYLNDVFWTNNCNTPPIKQRRNFHQNWCRMSKARLEWRSILAPCVGNTRLGVTKEGWGRENATDPVKSYISLWDIRPVGQFSKFSIQSQTSDGRLKKIGGDAWRIHLTGPSSIAPTVFDLNNGTYEVLFLAMEPGVYKAEIMLDYTLCDGLRDPPDDWFKLGRYINHDFRFVLFNVNGSFLVLCVSLNIKKISTKTHIIHNVLHIKRPVMIVG